MFATVAVALTVAAVPPDAYWVFVGTYTGGKSGSKGIYRAKLDAKTGKLSAPEVAAEVGSPSFVAIGPGDKTLYAVGESAGKDGGGVYAFALDAGTGTLTKLAGGTSGGNGPCHVSTDPAGKLAVVANYGGGSTALLALAADGGIAKRAAFVQHKGSSVNPARQKEPHAHCGFFDSTGKYALVADLGLDKVLVYDVSAGGLTPHVEINLPAGSGPRHLHLTPDDKRLYVCGELDSTANVVAVDLPAKKYAVIQSVSTLPGGKPVPGNSTAECRIHPSGKFVYVSNRGHNSIAAFAVGADGKLTPVGHATGGIKVPRNFNVTPCGKWMLVASQDGDDVRVFAVGDDGVPQPTGEMIPVGRPVCVKFVPVK